VFSSVPYERGFNLLFHLEGLIGEEAMADFIKQHVKLHAYGHVETETWIQVTPCL
jgi:leukotriene-A4 hydrolase